MTDAEVRELTARALGWTDDPSDTTGKHRHWFTDPSKGAEGPARNKCFWDPLRHGTDAMLLAQRFNLTVVFGDVETTVYGEFADRDFVKDPHPGRAITRAAVGIITGQPLGNKKI